MARTGNWFSSLECLHTAFPMSDPRFLAVAHIDLLNGSARHPVVAAADANGFTTATAGHTGLNAIEAPNLRTPIATVMFNNFTVERGHQIEELFGASQSAAAAAVRLCCDVGIIPKENLDTDALVISMFIHGLAGKAAAELPTKISGLVHGKIAEAEALLALIKAEAQAEIRQTIFLNNLIATIGAVAASYRAPIDPAKIAEAFAKNGIAGHPFLGFDPKKFPADWVAQAVPTWISVLEGGKGNVDLQALKDYKAAA